MAKKDVWANPPKEKPRIVIPEAAFREKRAQTAEAEEEKLPRVSLPGAVKALFHEKWNCLCYNSRNESIVFRHEPPCDTGHTKFPAELTDEDFTSIVCEFRKEGFALGYENAVKAALRVSTMHSFDPVKEYLEGLEWDGVRRLEVFLAACFGAAVDLDATPDEQAREAKWISTISAKWPIGAVARVYDPGCQVDNVLIAESPLQGTRKSSAFRALAVHDEWFASNLPDIHSKDSVHHLLGPWIIELDELDALNRKEATSIKGFISRRVDRARLSYRKSTSNYPRRVIFCGSTNEDTYNTDATGGRRFWPFRVRETIRVDLIEQWRDQIWAEAVHRYKAGEKWWLDDTELEDIAREEQSKRFKGGVHLDAIRQYLERNSTEAVSIDDILSELGIPTENRHQMHQNEAARALQHLGWTRRRVTVKGKRAWRYVKSVLADSGP
ncbi:MAG: hypothetical protein JRD94_09625 [Deltaproteobacteria bacterium]|nr:hypothetical protein [Deltaproteobacteria bacterium]